MRLKSVVLAFLLVLVGSCLASAGEKRPVTVEDCVCTRRIVGKELALSPTGTHVAYIVQAPDVKTNRNNYQLLVRDLRQTTKRENGRLMLQRAATAKFPNPWEKGLSGLQWLAGGTRVAVLSREGEKSSIRIIDIRTGRSELVFDHPARIEEYSISGNGDVAVFSTKLPPNEPSEERARKARGFSITYGEPADRSGVQHFDFKTEIYLARKTNSGKKTVRQLEFSGLGMQRERALRGVAGLNLSPDGKYLLFAYRRSQLPEGWETTPYVKRMREIGWDSLLLPVLYDLRSGRLRLAFNAPDIGGVTSWAEDSRAFAIQISSPVGSLEYQKETEAALAAGDALYLGGEAPLFAVDVKSGSFTQVLPKLPRMLGGSIPIAWKRSDGKMLVRLDGKTLAWMELQVSEWKEISRSTMSLTGNNDHYPTVGNGDVAVGVSENPMVPPDFVLYESKTNQTTLLTDLNPEFRQLALGPVEELEWSNKYGARTTGYLIKPVGYEEGKRYPLVILTKGWPDTFICDTSYQTAFPPQPLAAAGFVVLMANDPSRVEQLKNHPGDMREAYNWMAMLESAVELLDKKGIADKNKVGVAGFSHTSWKTDIMLTHSDFRFVAASSADSGFFNYGAYWVTNNQLVITSLETRLGGPPYGKTFNNWLEYAPAFNAQNVQVPLLMEYMGSGINREPYSAYEFFAALKRQGKPVELYFYPQGKHVLDAPWERVASLRRNVAWFRFWLQGYEGKVPDYDPEQYVRWRALLKQHHENQRKLAANQKE